MQLTVNDGFNQNKKIGDNDDDLMMMGWEVGETNKIFELKYRDRTTSQSKLWKTC